MCVSLPSSLIPGASALAGFFLYLAYGNFLPVPVRKISIKLKEADCCSLRFGKSGKRAQLSVLRESPAVHGQGLSLTTQHHQAQGWRSPALTSRCPPLPLLLSWG